MRRRLIPGTALMFLDFETTGLSPADQPIAVGGILVNHILSELERFEMHICTDALREQYRDQSDWLPAHKAAFAVHKIPLKKVLQEGVSPQHVLHQIDRMFADWCAGAKEKAIIVSDNAAFEMAQYQKLLASVNRATQFHHSAWDVSFILELASLASETLSKPHNALKDAELLLSLTRKAVRSFGLYCAGQG